MRTLVLLPLLALALPVPDGGGPTFLLKWGTRGSANGQFWLPWDVAVDRAGQVYVTDFSQTSGRPHRVQKFNANGGFVLSWGTEGSGQGQFDEPRGIAIDPADRLFVCDTYNRRIQIFDSGGAWQGQVPVPAGPFGPSMPYDVALDALGNLYVADVENHAILKLDPQGALITRWGGYGSGDGQLDQPWSVAVNRAGTVFVADRQNHRIQKFGPTGAHLGGWGAEGGGPGQFVWPRGVHVDAQGNVFVTDQIHRVQKFTASGDFIYQFGAEGILDGQFEFPTGMTTYVGGAMQILYIVDQESNRIQKFGDAAVPVTRTTWGRIKALYRR